MGKFESWLQNLIEKEGFDEAKSMLGLTTIELIEKSDCPIDAELANELIPKLFNDNVLPSRYKNCLLSYSRFEGILEWNCDWSDEGYNDNISEDTVTLATPFWDGRNGVPVDTSLYTVVDSVEQGNILSDDDFPNQECYSHIEWNDNFNSFSDYKIWIRKFYLPQVHSIIRKHLDNYRNYED